MSGNQKVALIAWCAFMAMCAIAAATSNLRPVLPPLQLHCETRP